jgi:hypothetical protein
MKERRGYIVEGKRVEKSEEGEERDDLMVGLMRDFGKKYILTSELIT